MSRDRKGEKGKEGELKFHYIPLIQPSSLHITDKGLTDKAPTPCVHLCVCMCVFMYLHIEYQNNNFTSKVRTFLASELGSVKVRIRVS